MDLSDYEIQREKNIKENKEKLEELGLGSTQEDKKPKKEDKKIKPKNMLPIRRSTRVPTPVVHAHAETSWFNVTKAHSKGKCTRKFKEGKRTPTCSSVVDINPKLSKPTVTHGRGACSLTLEDFSEAFLRVIGFGPRSNNKVGYKWVHRNSASKYQVQVHGKHGLEHNGMFDCLEVAALAVNVRLTKGILHARDYLEEHARLWRPVIDAMRSTGKVPSSRAWDERMAGGP